MLKRFVGITALLLALLSTGIWIQACQSAVATMSATPTAAPLLQASSTAALTSLPTTKVSSTAAPLWITTNGDSSNGLLALDPQTGEQLASFEINAYSLATSSDGRWRYEAQIALQNGRWNLELTTLDLQRGAITRLASLGDVTLLMPKNASDVPMDLALSGDNRLLALTVTSTLDTRWYADVYLYDTVKGTGLLTLPIQAFNEPLQKDPPVVQAVVSSDDKRVFVMEDIQRLPTQAEGWLPFWSTKIAVVNVDSKQVEQTIAVPGEIQTDWFENSQFLSPDGRKLYLTQSITRANDMIGYRFVALDTNKLSLELVRQVDSAKGTVLFCGDSYVMRPRFSVDGRYLIGFCAGQAEQFQFLDTQTGLVAQTIPVDHNPEPAGQQNFQLAFMASPDGKLLYLVHEPGNAIDVFDPAQRTIVRRTVLKDVPSTGWDPARWFGELLVPTASAKIYPQPAVVFSADGERLYLVGIKDMETGDGVWGVDTATLKPLGHWLAGQEITGVQLSGDGQELYALDAKSKSIVVLDAHTGALRRTLSLNGAESQGFATADY